MKKVFIRAFGCQMDKLMSKHVFSFTNVKRISMFLTIIVIATMVSFIFFEGICSVIFVVKSLHSPIAERISTKYDELLGWVSIPNVFIKNMYGDGIYLRTNLQGFRSSTDFSVAVPKGKIRLLCSGDSFTLGYGVDNDHTWCQLLASINEHLEVVNMGQGGYGIDQAYLWYMRDGIKLEHQIHIFAVIGGDFGRFGSNFLGYNKPYLKLQNNSLAVCNIPVPKRPYYIPWLTENIKVINELKSIRILKAIDNNLARNKKQSEANKINDEPTIAIKIFEELHKINKLKNSTLIVVYLPTAEDLNKSSNPGLREFLGSELSKRNIMFLDLVDDFRKVPSAETDGLFINNSKYYLGGGHYTVKGNQYVANIIYKKLLSLIKQISYE